MQIQDVSGLDEMRNVLAESELEYAFMALLEFCEVRGLNLEGDDVEPVLAELTEWLDNGGLSEDDKARLTEFASTIRRVAKAAGRAVGAFRRAKRKISAFKAGVKHAYNSGKAAGARSRGPRKPVRKPSRPRTRPKKPGVPRRPPSGGARRPVRKPKP